MVVELYGFLFLNFKTNEKVVSMGAEHMLTVYIAKWSGMDWW